MAIKKLVSEIKNVKAIENIAAGQRGGAGITSAEIIAKEKVGAVITANLGPRAFSVFEQFEIKIYQGEGKVGDAVQKFIEVCGTRGFTGKMLISTVEFLDIVL